MALKYGTILAREKIITPGELEDALRNQVIYGGRLGTILLELGHIDIATHKRLLSRHFGVPCADQADLEDAPRDVIRLISPEKAEKYEIHPIRLEGRKLHLAMANPNKLPVIDEISFTTGLSVVPYAVPEIVLAYYLEKNYGIQRKARTIRLSETERIAIFTDRAATAPSPPPASAPPAAPAVVQPSEEEIPAVPDDPISVEEAIARLEAATSRDEIGRTLLQFARQGLDVALLFVVKKAEATGWMGVQNDSPRERIAPIIVPLHAPSFLKTVEETGNLHFGPVPPEALNQAFFASLRRDPPPVALVVPIAIRRKVINILYGDAGARDIDPTLPAKLSRLTAAAGSAYERLILESKKRMEL